MTGRDAIALLEFGEPSSPEYADALKLAIETLKAQEPIIPHMVDWGIYECPICKTRVDKTYKFCKVCGKGMKWK